QAADRHPLVDGLVEAGAVVHHAPQRHARDDHRDENAEDREGVRKPAADAVAAEGGAEDARDERARERRQRDGQERGCVQGRSHGLVLSQPLSVFRSSTLMLFLLRNRSTRIARPIALSAAATVRMKNTNTWPCMSPR